MHDKTQNFVAIAMILSLMILGASFFWGAPSLKAERLELATQKKAVTDLQTKLEAIKQQEKKLLSSEAKVQSLLLALPKDEDVPNLIVMLEHLAQAAGGIKFTNLQPSEPKPEGALLKVPVNIAFTGSYDQFQKLLELFRSSLRPFTVEVLSVVKTESGVSVTMQLATFAQAQGGGVTGGGPAAAEESIGVPER